MNWTKISGSFIADSAYSYVMLGNFFDDNHTDTLNLQQFPYAAYYFFDDICVSTDSLFNETWTGIENLDHAAGNNISIFPNPVNDILTVGNLPKGLIYIKIIDVLGKNYFTKEAKFDKIDYKVDLSFLNSGIYIITFFCNSRIYSKKIIRVF